MSEIVPSQFELEQMGLIKHTKLPMEFAWVTPDVRTLLLMIAAGRDIGIPLKRIEKFGDVATKALIDIEVRSCADRVWDPRAKQHFCVLTWQGSEIVELIERTMHNKRTSTYHPIAEESS